MRSFLLSFGLLLLCLLRGVAGRGGAMQGMEDAMDIQREQLERLHDFLGPETDTTSAQKRQQPSAKGPKNPKAPATITFANPEAKKFAVDGTKIPDGKMSTMEPRTCH